MTPQSVSPVLVLVIVIVIVLVIVLVFEARGSMLVPDHRTSGFGNRTSVAPLAKRFGWHVVLWNAARRQHHDQQMPRALRAAAAREFSRIDNSVP